MFQLHSSVVRYVEELRCLVAALDRSFHIDEARLKREFAGVDEAHRAVVRARDMGQLRLGDIDAIGVQLRALDAILHRHIPARDVARVMAAFDVRYRSHVDSVDGIRG